MWDFRKLALFYLTDRYDVLKQILLYCTFGITEKHQENNTIATLMQSLIRNYTGLCYYLVVRFRHFWLLQLLQLLVKTSTLVIITSILITSINHKSLPAEKLHLLSYESNNWLFNKFLCVRTNKKTAVRLKMQKMVIG